MEEEVKQGQEKPQFVPFTFGNQILNQIASSEPNNIIFEEKQPQEFNNFRENQALMSQMTNEDEENKFEHNRRQSHFDVIGQALPSDINYEMLSNQMEIQNEEQEIRNDLKICCFGQHCKRTNCDLIHIEIKPEEDKCMQEESIDRKNGQSPMNLQSLNQSAVHSNSFQNSQLESEDLKFSLLDPQEAQDQKASDFSLSLSNIQHDYSYNFPSVNKQFIYRPKQSKDLQFSIIDLLLPQKEDLNARFYCTSFFNKRQLILIAEFEKITPHYEIIQSKRDDIALRIPEQFENDVIKTCSDLSEQYIYEDYRIKRPFIKFTKKFKTFIQECGKRYYVAIGPEAQNEQYKYEIEYKVGESQFYSYKINIFGKDENCKACIKYLEICFKKDGKLLKTVSSQEITVDFFYNPNRIAIRYMIEEDRSFLNDIEKQLNVRIYLKKKKCFLIQGDESCLLPASQCIHQMIKTCEDSMLIYKESKDIVNMAFKKNQKNQEIYYIAKKYRIQVEILEELFRFVGPKNNIENFEKIIQEKLRAYQRNEQICQNSVLYEQQCLPNQSKKKNYTIQLSRTICNGYCNEIDKYIADTKSNKCQITRDDLKVYFSGEQCEENFNEMNGFIKDIKIQQYPVEWVDLKLFQKNIKECVCYSIDKNSQEYKKIVKQINSNDISITNIQRIQNKAAWVRFNDYWNYKQSRTIHTGVPSPQTQEGAKIIKVVASPQVQEVNDDYLLHKECLQRMYLDGSRRYQQKKYYCFFSNARIPILWQKNKQGDQEFYLLLCMIQIDNCGFKLDSSQNGACIETVGNSYEVTTGFVESRMCPQPFTGKINYTDMYYETAKDCIAYPTYLVKARAA